MIEEQKRKPRINGWIIIVSNQVLFIGYTVFCYCVNSPVLVPLMAVHFVGCLIMGVVVNRKEWFLAALLMILVGISTCAGLYVMTVNQFHRRVHQKYPAQ